MIRTMAAAVHTAPQGGQIRHIEIAMQGGAYPVDGRQTDAEQLPAMKNSVSERVD